LQRTQDVAKIPLRAETAAFQRQYFFTVFKFYVQYENAKCVRAMYNIHMIRSRAHEIIIIVSLLAQKHDRVTSTTTQSEQDSKDIDPTNYSRPRNVQVKTIL